MRFAFLVAVATVLANLALFLWAKRLAGRDRDAILKRLPPVPVTRHPAFGSRHTPYFVATMRPL